MTLDLDCIIINLDREKKRWKEIHGALNRLGIPHRRFSAVDGKTIGNRYDFLMALGVKEFAPRGVLGSALSHRLALLDFLERDASLTCLLLEDDAIPDLNTLDTLRELMSQTPENWDIIKLTSIPRPKNGPLFHKNKYTIDACAQLISRRGAEKLTKRKINFPVYPDGMPWFIRNLNVYTVRSDHNTFKQTWETSSVAGTRYPVYALNLKVLRLGNSEFVTGDFLVGITVFIVALNLWPKLKKVKKGKAKR